jgi:hypothetical protein
VKIKPWGLVVLSLSFLLVHSSEAGNKYADIDVYIDSLNSFYSSDTIKAMAWVESRWEQFRPNGQPFVYGSLSGMTGKVSHDWGIMQLNEVTLAAYGVKPKYIRKLKCDTKFNIRVGVSILEDKYRYVRRLKRSKRWSRIVKQYKLKGMGDRDMAILAYNGFQENHIYLRLVKRAIKDKPWENKLK